MFGNPAEDGKEYLLKLGHGYDVDELDSDDGGFFFPAHDWCEIKAWAEIPEATEWRQIQPSDKERLEKEKCELLGIIQRKDEIIRKMRNCDNCKHFQKIAELEIVDWNKDELKEPCNLCENLDKWEFRG